MTAQGLREAELAVCEVSTEIPFSNDNAIMHNIEFELHLFVYFSLNRLLHMYIPIASCIKYYILCRQLLLQGIRTYRFTCVWQSWHTPFHIKL